MEPTGPAVRPGRGENTQGRLPTRDYSGGDKRRGKDEMIGVIEREEKAAADRKERRESESEEMMHSTKGTETTTNEPFHGETRRGSKRGWRTPQSASTGGNPSPGMLTNLTVQVGAQRMEEIGDIVLCDKRGK